MLTKRDSRIPIENDKITAYNDFKLVLNGRINGLQEFNVNEPLNFENKVGRGSNEVEFYKK
jgi:hypothetical protein